MSSLSLVLPAETTHHTPLPPLPCMVSDGTSPAPDLLQQGNVLGGYVGGSDQLVWRALGPTVEVLGSSTGTRVAAWTFGAVFRSTTAKVLSVCGVGGCSGAITHIVCGVDRGPEASPRGLLAVLSLASSKIVRAFTFPHPVVAVCVVRGGDAWVDDSTLHPSLRSCSPLVVLATRQPSLHMLDLALDIAGDSVSSDELSPSSLVGMPPLPPHATTAPPSFLQHRMSALRERLHFGATLLEGSVSGGVFSLLGPMDSVLYELPVAGVQITALLYIPQLACLAIGYNFGAFQLYNFHTKNIDCASPFEEGVPGVISFAYQEPENDPRNCVYLWLCRSIDPITLQDSEPPCDTGAVCTLYSMTYKKREWIEGHGLWYQGLDSIVPRFEFEADGSPCPVQGGGDGNPRATVMFTSHTVTRPSPPATPPPLAHCPPSLLLAGPEDEGTSTVSDLSLCMFGWYSRTVDDRGRQSTQHFVGLFDINQWYQAQMPATAQLSPGRLCPYMSFHRLDRVPCGPQERVLAAAPLTITGITRHMAPTGTSVRDWYPAALSYGVGVLSSSGSAWYRCRSAPQWCLRWLLAQGPAAVLLCPQETLLRCSFAGIMPLSGAAVGDIDSSAFGTCTAGPRCDDRETVLDVCLSQQLLSVLNDCVSEFSDGKFSSVGCSLPSLLQWAWARVTRTKADNDTLLSLVFSRGDCQLTPEQLQRLHHNLTVLGTLRSVLSMCAQHTPQTTRHAGGGVGEVGALATVVSLLQQHLTVTLWFQHCQLLPEVDPSLAMDDSNAVPYPAGPLTQIYKNKRREIGALNAQLEGSELLLIDQLMAELVKAAGGSIDGWPGGVYPPPSLQALLNIYLLADPPLHLKHRIVQYLFIDLSSILTDGFVTAVEYLIKFPASAKLSPSIIKLTQAFWLLDHLDYQSAVDLFLDPLVVRTDITVDQHRRIIRALLCQEQASLALTYLEGRAPPHQSPEDAQLHLSVLLACGRVREAYHYQRQHATATSQQHLLQHLLQGCEHYGRLGDLLQLPLLKSEEAALLQHLKTSDHPHGKEVYTIYCLRNARYSSIRGAMPGTVAGTEAHAARSALLRSYSTHFPAPTAPQHDTLISRRCEYSAPQPLSARIRQAAVSPNTRVTDYNKRLAHLTDAPSSQQSFTPFRSTAQRRKKFEDVDLSKSHCSVLFPSRLLDTTTGSQRAPSDRMSILAATTTPVDKRLSSVRDVSSHIMALLSSPPVARRNTSLHSTMAANPALAELSTPPTPQSILKVRSLLQRPSSPCSSVGDLTVPAPRVLTPRQITIKIPDEESPNAAALCLTPKQLRFALPTPPLLEASNDATMSSEAASSTVKPAPVVVSRNVPDGTDSDEHSDLDVQLEPYIHRTSKHESTPSSGVAAQALYEEQDSWEMVSESQLRLNVSSSHKEGKAVSTPSKGTAAAPSFSGVLQRLSQTDADRSKVSAAPVDRDVQTPPVDDDNDSVSDTNEQYYSFDSEDQEHEEQQNDEEEPHKATENPLQCRVVQEEEQVVEKTIQVEKQEVVDVEQQEEVMTIQEEVQQVVYQDDIDDARQVSKLQKSKSSTSRIDAIEMEAETVPRDGMRRSSKRKRDSVFIEEQSSQDAFELDEQKRNGEQSRTLVNIEEQDSQDASFVSSANRVFELNEISVEDVAECLHEKVQCETELRFSDSSEDNGSKKQLDATDTTNSGNVQTAIIATTTKRVHEVLPELQFSPFDDDNASKHQVTKKKTSVVSVKTTTTTSFSKKVIKGKDILPDLVFSDSEEDAAAVSVKRSKTKSAIKSSNSAVKSVRNTKAPRESLPVLQFSDSEEEVSKDKQSERTKQIELLSHQTSPSIASRRETLPSLVFSSSSDEEVVSEQPSKALLKEEPTPLETSSNHQLEESLVDARRVETEKSVVGEIIEEIDTSEQMEVTLTTENSSVADKTVEEVNNLMQVEAATTIEEKSNDEIVQEMDSSEQVDSTITNEKSLANNETIDKQQACLIIEDTVDSHKDSSSKVSNISVSNVEDNNSTKEVETSSSSSVKPIGILDSPSKPSAHVLQLVQESIAPEADAVGESPIDRRRGKSADRTPSKTGSSFGRKLETSKLVTGSVTPIKAASRSRAASEEPTSIRHTTPAKSALRGRQLIGLSKDNIIEPPDHFADIRTPVTPLRRSSRRFGRESPIIAKDVGSKGEILSTPSKTQQELPLLQIPENDGDESDALSSVDIPAVPEKATADKEATATIKLEETIKLDEPIKTAMDVVKSEMDGFESDSSLAPSGTMSPSRRGRRSSLGGMTDLSTPTTPVRRSSRRSVTPSKFGTPVLDPVPEENTPKKARRTPMKSAIKELMEEDEPITPQSVSATEEVTTPASGARRGRRKSLEPVSVTPGQSSASDVTGRPTPTPGRRGRRKSITALEPLIEETSEVEEVSSTDPSPSLLNKSSRKAKRLSVAPELPPIEEDGETPKTGTPTKGRRSRQPSPASEGTPTDSDASSSQTLLKNATKNAKRRSSSTNTSVKDTPLKTDPTEIDETATTVSSRSRRKSSIAPSFSGASSTMRVRLRKSISSMKAASDLDTNSSEDSDRRRRRSSRPSPALSSSVVYHTPKAYSSSEDEEEEEDQENPYPPPSPSDAQSEDDEAFEKAESVPRGIKLRPLKMATPKGGEGPRRRLSQAPDYVVDHGRKMRVGLKRSRQSMKSSVEEEEEEEHDNKDDEDAERRTKRPRRCPSTSSGRKD